MELACSPIWIWATSKHLEVEELVSMKCSQPEVTIIGPTTGKGTYLVALALVTTDIDSREGLPEQFICLYFFFIIITSHNNNKTVWCIVISD
jgi:hypothetical protein